jgi:hypothetical protein
MRRPLLLGIVFLQIVLAQSELGSPAFAQTQTARPHNVVLFIADGMRARMVDDRSAPTMAALAHDGVNLRNGHALFPTFTMANASGMATGHMLGDTGTFSNTILRDLRFLARAVVSRRSWRATLCSATSTSISPAITSTKRPFSSSPATKATAPPRSGKSVLPWFSIRPTLRRADYLYR